MSETPSLIVNTTSLRIALKAVLPHISTDDDGPSALLSARVIASGGEVRIVATDRFTAAVATVETPGTDEAIFDLGQDQIKKILAMFRPPKDFVESAELSVELEDDGKTVVFTDVSGMFPGDSMTLSGVAPRDNFPDVRAAITAQMMSPLTADLADVNPAFLARLNAAAPYGPLTMAHGDKSVWFLAEHFQCVIMVAPQVDEGRGAQ